MQTILEKAKSEHNLSESEVLILLKDGSDELFEAADFVRKEFVGDGVHLRGLIEFSNYCKQTCHYCGLRCENKMLERYRLEPEQILKMIKDGVDAGYKTIVLQSGEDEAFSTKTLCKLIENIKKFDVAITLGVGEKSFETYKSYKDAGADRFLLRIETTDKELYRKLHPHMDFENRLRCLNDLKELGYEVGSGCLVGLPEQTLESLAKDIIFFKKNNFDMIGIGPFIAHPDTPLCDSNNGDFELSLRVMAITRLLLPDINIPATTAMETLCPNGRVKALKSGANVIMPNITGEFAEKYSIYPEKAYTNGLVQAERNNLSSLLSSIGRKISNKKGFRKKN